MNTANAIAVGLLLSSFALLGTWAGTVGNVRSENTLGAVRAAASPQCPYEDQTGGVGGQSGGCSFECGPGTISLSVSADDGDAGVSGSGSCGDGALHCSDKGSCGDTQATSSGGTGSCSGDSDEAFDSGLYVSCSGGSTTEDPTPTLTGAPTPPECPVVVEPSPPYPRVCVPPDLGAGANADELPLLACRIITTDGRSLCEIEPTTPTGPDTGAVEEKVSTMNDFILAHFATSSNTVSAHIFAVEGMVTGLVCWGFDCLQRAPDCSTVEIKGKPMRCDLA